MSVLALCSCTALSLGFVSLNIPSLLQSNENILCVCHPLHFEHHRCRDLSARQLFYGEALKRILVLDDFKPWHNLVTAALESDPEYKVVGFAGDHTGAIEQCQVLAPDVVLLEVDSVGWNGLFAARKIREVAPAAQMIFFTNHVSLDVVAAAFEVGARGLVAKLDCQELLQAVNAVVSGQEYLSEQVRRESSRSSTSPKR
jgi:DNA-binding NarL/FixJ family response regulator